MIKRYESRLTDLERRLNPPGATIHVVIIQGGLPGPISWATAGPHQWLRHPNESLNAFSERAVAAAKIAKEATIVIGGLPNTPEQDEIAYANYLNVSAFSDDCPPDEE